MLSLLLTQNGYQVSTAAEGETGLSMAIQGQYDLVILDIMLPGLDGLSLLQSLRQTSRVPVLMLTARGDDIDRILGFELGADDYLPKPFNPRELLARIKAILRRVALDQAPPAGPALAPLRLGPLELVPERRQAWLADTTGTLHELVITGTEYNILQALLHQAGRLISKAELTQSALGRPLSRYDRALDMHISNLRKKLGAQVELKTVRGMGYLLQAIDP